MSRSARGVMHTLALFVACAGVVPVPAYGQSLKERLVGTWTLVSWTRVVDDVEQPGLFPILRCSDEAVFFHPRRSGNQVS